MKRSLHLLLLFAILSLIGCGKKETTITNLAELAGGKTFAVPTGTVADQFVLKRFPDAKIKYYNSPLDCALAVQGGKANAGVYDLPVLKNIVARNEGLSVLPELIVGDRYGFGFRQADTGLKQAVDGVLAELKSNGTYDDMMKRWFPDKGSPAPMPDIPLTGANGVLRFGTAAVTKPMSFVNANHNRQLISEGINVNVTLLFGLPRYRQAAESFIAGLEARAVQGKPVKHIASVASFFLSRIDTLVDPLVEKFIEPDGKKMEIAKKVHGQVAISSAKAAYQIYKEIFGSNRFKKLADKGARAQRLLWASTGTKNPDYSDIKYIEPIIGSDTVNTVPLKTIDAYRDHGDPKLRLEQDVKEANWIMARLPELGISIDKVTQQLEDEGVKKFNEPFDKLMEALTKKTSE